MGSSRDRTWDPHCMSPGLHSLELPSADLSQLCPVRRWRSSVPALRLGPWGRPWGLSCVFAVSRAWRGSGQGFAETGWRKRPRSRNPVPPAPRSSGVTGNTHVRFPLMSERLRLLTRVRKPQARPLLLVLGLSYPGGIALFLRGMGFITHSLLSGRRRIRWGGWSRTFATHRHTHTACSRLRAPGFPGKPSVRPTGKCH